MRKAEVHVQLKPGIFGIRVRIMPPDAVFPDRIQIVEAAPPEEVEKTEKPEEVLEEAEAETGEATIKEETVETTDAAAGEKLSEETSKEKEEANNANPSS
jgi:small subunit ribosomal protein S3